MYLFLPANIIKTNSVLTLFAERQAQTLNTMAGSSKETPRQKMIGMMYLVLTALLALNVSKDILKGFITVNESIERTNAALIDNQVKTLEDFRVYAKTDSIARGHLKLTEDIFKLTQASYDYVAKIKSHVIAETEKLDNKSAADTMHLRYTEKQDDYDTPTYLLIGDDAANPKDGELTAKGLKKNIIKLHDDILAQLKALQSNPDKRARLLEPDYNRLVRKVEAIYPVDPKEKVDGVAESWETQNFNQLPLAAVVTNLTKIQNDIKSVETSFISELSSASRKSRTPIDKFNAQVISSNGYVQQGQTFKADIFLSASSSDFNDTSMQVLLGGEYDFAKKSAIKEGTPINSVAGVGKYEVVTSAQGNQVIKGAIKLKSPQGIYEYYPYEYNYMVAAPSVAVSPDKMNVLYVGLDNPVSISAAGVAPSQLVITASGCKANIKPAGNGKYTINAGEKGDCFVTVSAKQADGSLRQQGPPMKFRVKMVPNPVARIGGKDANGSLDFKQKDLNKIGAVAASLPNFEFENVNFNVVSYTLIIPDSKNQLKSFDMTTANLTPQIKSMITSLKSGSKFFVENIKAVGPGGQRNLGDVIVKVTK